MASKRNWSHDDIVFLKAKASNKSKSNKLEDFHAKIANNDLDLLINLEKIYEVVYSFSLILFIIVQSYCDRYSSVYSNVVLVLVTRRLEYCFQLTNNNSSNYSSQLSSLKMYLDYEMILKKKLFHLSSWPSSKNK